MHPTDTRFSETQPKREARLKRPLTPHLSLPLLLPLFERPLRVYAPLLSPLKSLQRHLQKPGQLSSLILKFR
jgi:hypothetical protein